MDSILITGSSGLVGSEVACFYSRLGFTVHGIDNNQRAIFFGPQGDTRWRQQQLGELPRYHHHDIDIRDRQRLLSLVKAVRPHVIVNAAAQPSHDLAAAIPFDDFDTNATGTLNLLEAARQFCPEASFIHMSTNKVYGDLPNSIPLADLGRRWDFADPTYRNGIGESFAIDQTLHSLFGASKVAADILVQEYGRYLGLPTCSLRCGCLTGPNHAGVELHGFLSYLVKCNLEEREYTIFGYGGKQVRDNLHAEDVARFIHTFHQAPRFGEVYNLGGGKENSCSIIEAFELVEGFSGKKQVFSYLEQPRRGDHICYYSDLSKTKAHYPDWNISKTLRQIVAEIVDSWRSRLG